MISVVGVFGAVLFVTIYVIMQRIARVADPEGSRLVVSARYWRDKYALPPRCAWSVARGVQVSNTSFLFLAVGSLFGAYGAAHPDIDTAFAVFVMAMVFGLIVMPLLGALVGFTGKPRAWLRPGSDVAAMEDM